MKTLTRTLAMILALSLFLASGALCGPVRAEAPSPPGASINQDGDWQVLPPASAQQDRSSGASSTPDIPAVPPAPYDGPDPAGSSVERSSDPTAPPSAAGLSAEGTPSTPNLVAGGTPNWAALPPMSTALSRAAGAFAAGKFFVIGGEESGGPSGKVQIYDPTTGSWTPGPNNKPTPVSNVCAAVIGNKIYVPGGYTGSTGSNTLEVLDAVSLTWSTITTDPLPQAQYGHACGVIGDKLYIAGGTTNGSDALNQSYKYDSADAAGSRWSAAPALNVARRYTAGVGAAGGFYVAGGLGASTADIGSVEVFDPAANKWTRFDHDLQTSRGAPGTYAAGSRLIVCGGGWNSYRTSCEWYDIRQGTKGSWQAYPAMGSGRRTFAYATDGTTLYAAGGYAGSYLNSAEVLSALPAWTALPPVPVALSRAAGAFAAGKFFVIGGEESSGATNKVRIYNPATNAWTAGPNKPTAASNLCAAVIGNKIYVPGGYAGGVGLSTLEVLDAVALTWSTITTDPLPQAQFGHACGVISNKLYLAGGTVNGSDALNQSYEYDPSATAGSRWRPRGNLNTPRRYAGGVAIDGRFYAVGGFSAGGTDIASVEVYDPSLNAWVPLARGMQVGRAGPAAFAAGSRLIACAGGWSSYWRTCEAYDTQLGAGGHWVSFPSLISGRRTVAYASGNNVLYAATGYAGGYLATAERIDAGPFEVIASVYLPLSKR